MTKRIAIVGAGGIGKSTILKPLSEEMNLEIKQFTTREFMTKYHFRSQDDVVAAGAVLPNIGISFQKELIEQRSKYFNDLISKGEDNFVTDRLPLDSLAYYLIHNSYWDVASNTNYLKQVTKDCCNRFDYIFTFCTKVFPVENDGVRGTNPEYHEIIQSTILNSAKELGINVITVPFAVKTINDRVKWIKDYVLEPEN